MISISLPLAIFAVSFSVDGQVRELGFEYMENGMSYVALYMIQLIQEIGIMTKKFPHSHHLAGRLYVYPLVFELAHCIME